MNNYLGKSLFFSLILLTVSFARAAVVNCDAGDSLAAALDAASPGDSISVSGVCHEAIVIRTNDIVIQSNNHAVISAPFRNIITIDGAVRVLLSGLVVENGIIGINAESNASFTLNDVSINGNALGINLQSGAHAILEDVTVTNSSALGINLSQGAKAEITAPVQVSGSGAFGLNAQSNSVVRVDATTLTLSNNFFGGQITVSSSLFVDQGTVFANNNQALGLSINTGASAILFNANIDASNNQLDGLDTVSASNLDIDGTSTLNANNNGRDGISIDDGTINSFGFFVGPNPGPRITANNNGRNGVLVEFGGRLDIGVNSAIEARNNTAAGIAIDNGSIVQLRSSVLNGNGGRYIARNDNEDDEHRAGKSYRNIDLLATFASRVTFVADNQVGNAVCDRSSLSRGDVRCRR